MNPGQKESGTLLDDLLDQIVANPKRFSIALLLFLIGAGIWRRDWLISTLGVSEEGLKRWLEAVQLYATWALIAFVVFMIIRHIVYVFRIQRTYQYVEILPHADDSVSAEDLFTLMRRIHGTQRKLLERLFLGREWFSFMIHRNSSDEGSKYKFYIGAEEKYLNSIKTLFKSVYTRMEFFEVEDISVPSPKAVGGRLKIKSNSIKKSLPLARYRADQLPALLSAMEEKTWLQVGFSPSDGWRTRKGVEKLEADIKKGKRAADRSAFEQQELQGLKHRFSGNEVVFDCTVSMATEYYPGVQVLKNMANTICSVANDTNRLKYKKLKLAVQWYPTTQPYRMTWTGSELANLIHVPNFKKDSMYALEKFVSHSKRGMELLPNYVLNEGIPIGKLYHPFVQDRIVRVPLISIGKHFLATGLNGSGKSSLVNQLLMGFYERFIREDVAPAFSFTDPAGTTIETLLNQLIKYEADGHEVNWEKVHWISFRNTDYPPATNLLYKLPGESDETVVSSVMEIIRDNFQVAPQAERLFRNCIQALVSDPDETHTILGVKSLINDEVFRMRVLSRLKKVPEAYDVYDFWVNEAPDLIETSKTPLFNRLDIFSSNQILRRMFGQKEFGFPVRKWMDEGHIVFYDFRGLDKQMTKLIGGYLDNLYYRVADTRDEEGDPLLHAKIKDEAQRSDSSVLPRIVQESRKKGLALGTLTQSVGQLGKEFQHALKEAQGNFFVCKQGAEDAAEAANLFKVSTGGKDTPVYSEATLKTLPSRVAAIRTEDGDGNTVQCLVESPPLDLYFPDGSLAPFQNKRARAEAKRHTQEKAKQLQAKNGMHHEDVDLLIRAYLRGEDFVPPPKEKESQAKKAPVSKKPKTPMVALQKKKIDAKDEPEKSRKSKDQEHNDTKVKTGTEEREARNYSTGSVLARLKKG